MSSPSARATHRASSTAHARAASLPREALTANTAARSFDDLGFDGLVTLCAESAAAHAPDGEQALDPRLDLPIAYSEARARRLAPPLRAEDCVVCGDATCPAVDLASLPGDDLAWITPNLFPIAAPAPRRAGGLRGVHLVQWSSLRHDGGLIGADAQTAAALFAQWAAAEEWLLHHADGRYPESGAGHRGHVGLIKNRGRTVGGSVEHDHQQLLLVDRPFAEPRLTRDLAAALLRDTPAALVVETIDARAVTLVPPFMRRPLHAFVVPRAAACGWLHHLDAPTRDALALAVARLSLATSALMAASGREPAWNLVCHSGEGCAPLFELRPYTQPLGGYEQLGLYVCEERPATSAARLRAALQGS